MAWVTEFLTQNSNKGIHTWSNEKHWNAHPRHTAHAQYRLLMGWAKSMHLVVVSMLVAHRHTDRQTNYCNPRSACTLGVNEYIFTRPSP